METKRINLSTNKWKIGDTKWLEEWTEKELGWSKWKNLKKK